MKVINILFGLLLFTSCYKPLPSEIKIKTNQTKEKLKLQDSLYKLDKNK